MASLLLPFCFHNISRSAVLTLPIFILNAHLHHPCSWALQLRPAGGLALFPCFTLETLHASHPEPETFGRHKWINLDTRTVNTNIVVFPLGFRICEKFVFWGVSKSCPLSCQTGCLVLRGILLDLQVFGDTADGYKGPINKAFDEFSAWRKRMKIPCSQKRFTVKGLVRETTYGWFLNAKGFNSRVVSEWVMYKVMEVNAAPEFRGADDERLQLCEVALILVLDCNFFQGLLGQGAMPKQMFLEQTGRNGQHQEKQQGLSNQ